MKSSHYIKPEDRKIKHYTELKKNESNLFITLPNLGRSYIDECQLFLVLHGYLPNKISENKLDAEEAMDWFLKNFESEIKDRFFCKRCFGKNESAQFDDCIFIMPNDLLLFFDIHQGYVIFLFKKTPIKMVEELVKNINQFKIKPTYEPEIHLLVRDNNGMDLESFSLNKPKLTIADNYNDDFLPIHETIVKRLSNYKDKGLILLHGKPGTGKTSYIRYLAASTRKKIIFFPPNLAQHIASPELITMLISNPDSILIIEDAENIIIDRERKGTSPVSALLNLSDGLLADCLNIQIICSFNTDLSKVDSALMRKGRLIARYEFKELEVKKAQELSDKLGFKNYLSQPMTLTDIYNQTEMEFKEKELRRIGFGMNKAV